MSFVLSSTTDKVQVVSTGGTVAYDYNTHYGIASAAASPMVPTGANNKNGSVAAAGTDDITGSPAGANDRWSVWFDIRNTHASAAITIEVQLVKAGTAKSVVKVTLNAGWTLSRSSNGVWFVYDATGAVVQASAAASDTAPGVVQLALQSDQETATSTTLAVTPGRQQFHPSAAKFWVKSAGGSTTVNASYNTTSVANTATGRMTVTIGNDFSSVNWCCQVSTEPASNSTAVANRRIPCVANAGQAAGTVEVNAWDATATNNALANPTSWYVAGFGDI